MVRNSLPLAMLHTLSTLSSAVLTRLLPSDRNATAVIGSVWPIRVYSSLPVAASQTRTVRSLDPEAISLPSGLTARARTSRL